MKVYAIVPARSGSKGVKDKNIRLIDGKPLLAYSVNFAKELNCDRIFCSTDSEKYAEIAKSYGAEVPFLRSEFASRDNSMEEHILLDLYEKFNAYGIEIPDILVWLRPTFIFRDKDIINKGIEFIKQRDDITAVRTVCESESRLYTIDKDEYLIPNFDDKGKSMIRRQEIGTAYKVFSTDIFRFSDKNLNDHFLGNKIIGLPINKICGLDIDDEFDFELVRFLVESKNEMISKFIY